jgi:hypothetical protein
MKSWYRSSLGQTSRVAVAFCGAGVRRCHRYGPHSAHIAKPSTRHCLPCACHHRRTWLYSRFLVDSWSILFGNSGCRCNRTGQYPWKFCRSRRSCFAWLREEPNWNVQSWNLHDECSFVDGRSVIALLGIPHCRKTHRAATWATYACAPTGIPVRLQGVPSRIQYDRTYDQTFARCGAHTVGGRAHDARACTLARGRRQRAALSDLPGGALCHPASRRARGGSRAGSGRKVRASRAFRFEP